MGFKKTVVYIAIVLLIIILLVYGFTFYYSGVNNKQFPPVSYQIIGLVNKAKDSMS